MPTIRQVAQACGVSPMTVSFVLNNKRGQVSQETREKVLRAVREMGYRPRAVERHPKTPSAVCTLGVVTGVSSESLVTTGYYADQLRGLVTAADELGHNLTVFTSRLFRADTHESIRVYCDGRCDGLLLIAPSQGSQLIPVLRERGTPFVLVGDTGDDETLPCADSANVAEAERATSYLLEQGHRRVGFLGGPDFVHSALERQRGYRNALAAAGIPVNPRWVISNMIFPHVQVERVGEILRDAPDTRPTALFCWNDGAAHTARETIRNLGLRVPQDVSLIGFDDDPIATEARPHLTTIRQRYGAIGRSAVEILLAQIRGEAGGDARVLLPGDLIVRDSVAPPPD